MRVLVLGANGFIGSAIVTALREAGIAVRAVVRNPAKFNRRFPDVDAISIDLLSAPATTPEGWTAALDDIDAVANAAGVLQPRRDADAWAVHHRAPDALFAACEATGVRRVIQISAIGIDEAETVFARSKRAGDAALMVRDLDWTLLRPAVVIGEGSYGGTSMLRAIAAFPWATPVIGDGETPVDFIHKADLAAAVVRLLQSGAAVRTCLEPASRERMSLTEAVLALRRWLGLPRRPVVRVPLTLVRVLARIGDWTQLGPINSTSVAQIAARMTGTPEPFEAATGGTARGLSGTLASRAADTQDLWHARLYLLRPLVRLALALLWLGSGLIGLLADPARYAAVLAPLTGDTMLAGLLGRGMGLVDLAIAAALIAGWRLTAMANLQLLIVAGYTVVLTLLAPSLWGDLYGGLLKNLPVLGLILIHRILEEER